MPINFKFKIKKYSFVATINTLVGIKGINNTPINDKSQSILNNISILKLRRKMLQRKYTPSLANIKSINKLYLEHGKTIFSRTEELSPIDLVFLERVFKYIEKNIANEQMSIENLTQELAISRSHLFRKITALTGFPPARLIRNYRLELAMKMFKEHEQISIMEVVHTIGFSDPKYFSRVFREHFGVAPLFVKNIQ